MTSWRKNQNQCRKIMNMKEKSVKKNKAPYLLWRAGCIVKSDCERPNEKWPLHCSMKLHWKWGFWNSLGSSQNCPLWCNKLLQPQNKPNVDANSHPGLKVPDLGFVDLRNQDVNVNISDSYNNNIAGCYRNINDTDGYSHVVSDSWISITWARMVVSSYCLGSRLQWPLWVCVCFLSEWAAENKFSSLHSSTATLTSHWNWSFSQKTLCMILWHLALVIFSSFL